MRATLRKLAAMIAGGDEAIGDMLGLPLEAARHRAVERRTARLPGAAAERTQRLRAAATRALGGEAAQWLVTPTGDAGEPPLTLASGGDPGLNQCLGQLAAIARQREAERAEAAAIAARRAKLQAAVAKLYAPNLHKLALRNQSAPLGYSPWDACRTDHGLDSAIRVLTDQAKAGGRRR